jgi:hypothetical protein
MPRFLQFEKLSLHEAKGFAKWPRAGDSRTPLYNASLGKQPAKRRQTEQPNNMQQPSSSSEGRFFIISFTLRFVT